MLFVRVLAAAAATAALFGSLWMTHDPRGTQPGGIWAKPEVVPLADRPFVEAFANLSKERSFVAEIHEGGATRYISGTSDGKLRFDTEPGLYSIVDRDRQWEVNEAANRAAEVEGADYFYRRDRAALNPWRLIELEPETGKELAYREEELSQANGAMVASYFNARWENTPVAVETQVDALQQLPREITIWPRQNRGEKPLFRFHLTQAGGAADETKFKVAETLTEDGRIGKVIDIQGLVTVRPLTTTRWTPLCAPNLILQPGDWLRTDNRGANATTVQLAPQTKLIVGPGSLLELPKPDQLRVTSGIVQVTASEKTPVTLTGPDGSTVSIKGKEIWQVAQNKLQRVAQEPIWLAGYLGQTPQETLGSLEALVDGRNVKLTVGYHKVVVDIRDQIARTTIEESFVNHTKEVLDGKFYFPLPQDASISGFGMWIGNELVEADIVEKQRAREIFEQILREKRDPGLLEWNGGNIFSARVYPIPAQGEKRIKITYTQVLPLVGDSFRYSYALQSDLLKQSPLRQLELAVNIHSTQPLQQVQSPTHATRNQQTQHAARLEFSAQSYTPTRDFEVVTKLATRSQDLTLIPHQRGDDGFFMLLMQPPDYSGKWTRPLVNDSSPLELLILADTSASMDRGSRTRQAEVIAALLAALAPQDKFNLASVDVDCHWTFEKSVAAAPEQITKARDILQNRRSMGWTNLQRGWESALKQASPGAHIIYVGDGIVTRGAIDLAGDETAIKNAAEGQDVIGHAIAVSSSYESRILKAIAAVGGGSLRNAAGEVKPKQVANDLLVEATRPALRNISVSFEGFRTAAVYPPTLANLPAGTQQVVLGRYLPDGGNRQGKVFVNGTMNGKPVGPFKADIDLKQAPKAGTDDDASFIPRLWARLHLDELLKQGSSQQVQDQVIALSEEYRIMTPYTSLLILEDDAMRERFKVKKRFQMRDGERFFQKANDEARYALLQQQIQQAQLWRQELRQRAINELSNLGRDASVLEERRKEVEQLLKAMSDSQHEPALLGAININTHWGYSSLSGAGGMGGGGMGGGGGFGNKLYEQGFQSGDMDAMILVTDGGDSIDEFDTRLGRWSRNGRFDGEEWDEKGDYRDNLRSVRLMLSNVEQAAVAFDDSVEMLGEVLADYDFDAARYKNGYIDGTTMLGAKFNVRGGGVAADYSEFFSLVDGLSAEAGRGEAQFAHLPGLAFIPETLAWRDRRTQDFDYALEGFSRGTFQYPSRRQPLILVPLPYRVRKPLPRKIVTTWPADAIAILRRLEITEDLKKLPGGVSIVRQDDSFSTAQELSSRQEIRQLYAATAWLTRGDERRETAPLLAWCNDQERGNQSLAFDQAFVRKSEPTDLLFDPLLLNEGATRWDEMLRSYQVAVEHPRANRVLIIAKALTGEGDIVGGYEEYRWLIDTERNVVLESERRYQGSLLTRVVYGQFVQIGGRWLATTAEHFNPAGLRTGLVTLQLKELTPAQFRSEFDRELKIRSRATTFQLPLPKLADAEKNIAAGTGKPEDRLVVLARKYSRNQWDDAFAALAAGEQQSTAKAGWNWIRFVLLEESRRHEEVKQLLLQIGDATARTKHPAEYGIVHRLREISTRVTGGNEQLEFLDHVQPIYERFAEPLDGTLDWELERLQSLASAARDDERRDYLAQLAAKYPRNFSLQHQWIQGLRNDGDLPAAFAAIENILRREKWSDYEQGFFRGQYCDMLENEGRYADAAKYAREWTAGNPDAQEPYQRLLSYMVLSGQEQASFDLAQEWIDKNTPAAGKSLKGAAYYRVLSAVQLLLGKGRNIDRANLNPKYLPLLEKLLLQFVATDDAHEIARQIWQENEFHASATRLQLLQKLLDRVVAGANKLPPAQLEQLMEFVVGNTHAPEQIQQWKQVLAELERRWALEKKLATRTKYRELILRVSNTIGGSDHERLLRKFLAGALPQEKDAAVRQLFDHLLNQPWTAARETETLQLVEQISTAKPAEARLLAQISALYQWTDTLETRRRDDLNYKINRPDKLKRDELQKKQEANARQAREEISQRLLSAARAKGSNDPLAKWLLMEHRTLEIRLERKLSQVADQLWQWLQQSLDQQPQKIVTAEDEEQVGYRIALENAWQQRLMKSLLYLAARKDAPPADIARLRKLFEEQRKEQAARRAKAEAEAEQDAGDETPPEFKLSDRIRWQQLLYELLLIRDLPKDLQQTLRDYITVGDPTGHWRRQLARVSVELNKLEAGVQLLEELERTDLLGAGDYRSLAVWYHALDQKQKHEAAQVKVYRFQQPWQLHQRIQQHLSRWQNTGGPLPEQLDPQVLLMFAALLQTEEYPHGYLGTLGEFYQVTHDPRLLQTLAKALPGHTAERVYPMLKECWSVLTKVELEAAIDELIQGLDEVRKAAKTPLDERALDLFEVLAHRRAADLQNGAQPHVSAALAALARAEKRQWQAGEPQLMADFLAYQGVIPQPALAAEQLRLLQAMLAPTKPGSEAAFQISISLASNHWAYDRQQQAIDLLAGACEEYRQAQGGKVTQAASDEWIQVSNWQAERGQFLAAEKTLADRLPQVANRRLEQRFIHQRYVLHAWAIRENALTSLGRGEPLYRAVLAASRADAARSTDLDFLVNLADRTIDVIRAAHGAAIASAKDDLVQYSQQEFSRILARQVNGYDNSVNRMASALHDVVGPQAGIQFLLDSVDHEPVWVRYQGNDTWNRMSGQLGSWRDEADKAGGLGELEPRLLRFVVAELKRDLVNRNSRNRQIYYIHHQYFWAAKADAFAAAANEVYKEYAGSSQHVMYIAEYFFHGLKREDRAVEIMLDAQRRKLLEIEQQIRVVHLLHQADRYAESIPILEPIVQRHPLDLNRRAELMLAYFKTKQRQALVDLRQKTHDLFHQDQRWTEHVMIQLGNACLECELFEPAVEYLKEAVAVRTKALNNRTVNDSIVSSVYQALARGHAGLKQTKEAVDAASSGIVTWGSRHHERDQALQTLREVLRQSPDLAAYVKQLDQETNKTKQDRPIVRKMLGEVLQEQGKFAEAIVQFRAAVQLTPNDREIHAKLIECLDAANDPAGALAQSFESLELDRRNVDLLVRLADRFDEAKDKTEAERARTSLAEILPGEIEGHRALAHERENQDRWPEALEQWQKIAELRKLEATGLLNIARVQLFLKKKEQAAATIQQIESTTWSDHAMQEVREMLPELKAQMRE